MLVHTCAGRAKQEHALHMADAQSLHHCRREHSRGKGASEDLVELPVQASNAQALEVELLGLEEPGSSHCLAPED